MAAAALLLQAKETGITVWREGETLRYRGPNEAIAEWLPVLKEHKAEVLALLQPSTPSDAPTAWRWLLTYGDGRTRHVNYIGPGGVTREQVLERYPEAIEAMPLATYSETSDAEPHEPVMPPETPRTTEQEEHIRAWLGHIEETDPATITEVLTQCRRDADARAYYLERSAEVPHHDDDRRHCRTCRSFRGDRDPQTGYCTAYQAHVVDRPPRRCVQYVPRPDDPDQRTGRERWPRLGEVS